MKRKQMVLTVVVAAFFMVGASLPDKHAEEIGRLDKQKKWVRLFDGKTLNGWHTIPGGEWKLEDGAIVGRSKKEDQRHGLLVTDKTYKDFEVQLKYKVMEGNSGLYFRVDEVGGTVGVYGFQAEIDPNQDAGGLYETGGREWVVKPTPEQVKTWYKPGQWNHMSVLAQGGHIMVKVNGKRTAELKNDTGRTQGHIALQLHGSMDMHVMFKDILIKELKP